MTKTLALVADDYGLAPAIDRGILRLAARGRLSATSCIVNAPGWAAAAPALNAVAIGTGLHFNLTEGRPLSDALRARWPVLPALPKLIALAHLHLLPIAALGDELRAQLAAFEAARGQAPTHLDGHQHVHHLPQLRALALELVRERPGLRLRNTGDVRGPGFAFKRALIAGTGGRTLARRLHPLKQAQNDALFGVYDFVSSDYRQLFRGWLAALPGRGGLLFCHPGEQAPGDAIARARVRELAYFDSDDFVRDLAEAGVSLATH